jgi:hypothetical protein
LCGVRFTRSGLSFAGSAADGKSAEGAEAEKSEEAEEKQVQRPAFDAVVKNLSLPPKK